MKIACISDTHRRHRDIELPDADILVHAGDLTGAGNAWEFEDVGKWFEELKERYKYRIFIAGNHDFGFQFNAAYILEKFFDKDIIYLENSSVCVEGINFWGSPYSLPFYNWAFMEPEVRLQDIYAGIPNDTHVLITHTPSLGILDNNADKEKCGSQSLYNRLVDLAPPNNNLQAHIFGHIHENGGKRIYINGIDFVNACCLNEKYKPVYAPQVIEVNI